MGKVQSMADNLNCDRWVLDIVWRVLRVKNSASICFSMLEIFHLTQYLPDSVAKNDGTSFFCG